MTLKTILRNLSIVFVVFVILSMLTAPATTVSQESECACATELKALKTQFDEMQEEHFQLKFQHYRICRAKHGVLDHDIRPRSQ